jgi:internalin A
MDSVDLKRRFGKQLAFWGGGVDAQHVRPRGTPEAVATNVRQNVRALMPGGGYIFNNCHNIQGEVPPENILDHVRHCLRMRGSTNETCWKKSPKRRVKRRPAQAGSAKVLGLIGASQAFPGWNWVRGGGRMARMSVLNKILQSVARAKSPLTLPTPQTHSEIAEERIEAARKSKASSLDLDGLGLTELPESLGQLTQLHYLFVSHNQLTALPESLGQLTLLQHLFAWGNRLTALPESLGQLTQLQQLSVHDNQLPALPASLGQLTLLRELNVHHNQLPALPESLGQLTQLRELSVHYNRLPVLPTWLGQLRQLRRLVASDNQLTALPESLGQLTQLRELNVHNNQLTALPESLGQLTQLQYLIVMHNHLTALPKSLGQLAQLQQLRVHNNRLTGLPESLGQLAQLRHLDVSYNQLTALPEGLRRLAKLNWLFLHDNQALGLPPEVLGPTSEEVYGSKRAKPANPASILDYYFKTLGRKAESRALNEAKMILVGRGGVGKTCLVHRLVHGTYNPEGRKTDGIAITSWPVRVGQDDVRLNIWDFGGQEIMHATHQFFLTKRSLYLLVLNAREGEQDANVEYWLRLIESFGGDSPVLVVINKVADHAFDLNRRGLQAKFPAIRGFVPTDCETELGLEELRQAILRETDRLEHLRDPFPASWFTVKDTLAHLRAREGENFIPFARYQQLCAEQGVKEAVSQETLVGFLHDLGIVVNFRDHPRLSETQVLDPEWVTNGIYKILNADWLAKKEGELRLEHLSGVLDRKVYPREMHLYLVDLMRKFELCYEFYDGDGHYLVPELLGKEEPDLAEFAAPDALRFEYRYNILPEGLLPRFIVRSRALNKNLPRWRTGVVLAWDGNRAVVKADVQDRRVSIAITGPLAGRRRLLAVIRADLEHIHRSIVKLQATEQVPVPGQAGLVIAYKKLETFEIRGITEFVEEHEGQVLTLNVQEMLGGIEEWQSSERARQAAQTYRYLTAASTRRDGLDESFFGPVRVAFSYSHKDEELRDQLETHLKLLQRQGVISTWHDRKILGGENWAGVIDDNFRRADLILLLVSADFVASDYCYETEMKLALEREAKKEARVVPVILRACDWKGALFGKLQGFPKDMKPVTSWANRDEAWTNVAQGIRDVIGQMKR